MTDETKHTPGPWSWTIHDHSCASLGTGEDPGMGDPLVMSVSPCRSCIDNAKNEEWTWGRCTTPSEADSRLIAAAPELLDALPDLLPVIAWLANGCDPAKAVDELKIYQACIDNVKAKAAGK